MLMGISHFKSNLVGRYGTEYVEIDGNRFNATYGVELAASHVLYDDLRVPVTSTIRGGSKDPDFAKVRDNGSSSQGVFTFLFDKTLVEELYFSAQLPHTYQEGGSVEVHTHWMPTTTATGYVMWGFEYTLSNIDATFPITVIATKTDYSDGTQYQHRVCSIATIPSSALNISSMLMCRIFRNASAAGDTHDADAALLEVDFHYPKNTMGSKEIHSK